MCRFIAYLGKPILMDDVLFKPKNSLIKQSIRARETDEPLNGDGFGIGWYNHDIDFTPGVFVSIQPAWNDRNLMHLAKKIRSSCFFAHVRAASQANVAAINCHPFNYHRLLFMHNGDIGGFSQIKRFLRRKLNDEIYEWLQGQTDSEHFFALFLNFLAKKKGIITAEIIAEVLRHTIIETEKIKKAHEIEEPSYINAAITDGICIVAVRYVSDPKLTPSSLHFAKGAGYYCNEQGHFHMEKTNGEIGAIIIASEKLTGAADWEDIPANHILVADKYFNISIEPV